MGGFGQLGAGGRSGSSIPVWVPTQNGVRPYVYLDFVGNRGWVASSGQVALSSLLSITRASASTYLNTSNAISTISSGQLAIGNAGLQVYKSSTNIITQSNTFTDASWVKENGGTGTGASPVVTANAAISPDGTMNASQIDLGARSSTSHFQDIHKSFTSSAQIYQSSVWLKAVPGFEGAMIDVYQFNGGATINPVSLILTSFWVRVATTPTTAMGVSGSAQIIAIGRNTNAITANFDTAAVSFYMYQAQAETGGDLTPDIITTSSTVTRAADNISTTGALATALAVATNIVVVTDNAQQLAAATALDTNGTVLLGKTSGAFATTALGATLSSPTTATWAAPNTLGLTIGAAGAISLNNSVATDAQSRTLTAPFFLGSTGGSSAFWNGSISSVAVYAVVPTTFTQAASLPITSLTFQAEPFNYDAAAPTTSVATDTFYNTWADDGNIYTTFCDMDAGWQNQGAPNNSSNLGIAGLTTYTTSVVGTMVNNLVSTFGTHTQSGSDGFNWKATGLISVNGVLYLAAGRMLNRASPAFLQTQQNSQIFKSTDHGLTWTPGTPSQAAPLASYMFPGFNFSLPSPIQYATADYHGNTVHNSGTYVYWMSTASLASDDNFVYLARVKISDIAALDATKYTYYNGNGADGMLDANWSSSFANATPIMTTTGGYLGAGGAQYIPLCGRYLYLGTRYPHCHDNPPTFHTPMTQFSVWESPTPWGPWTWIQTHPWPVIALYFPCIMPKSLSADNGLTAVIAAAGDYNQGSQYTLQLDTININN